MMRTAVFFFFFFALAGFCLGNVLFKDDGISQTVPLRIHRKGILHLKSQILKILGLFEGPRNATRDQLASRFMSQLYQMEMDSEVHGASANFSSSIMEFLQKADTIVSFAPSRKVDFEEEAISELDFSLNDLPVHSRLMNAELRLHLNGTDLLLESVALYLRDEESGDLLHLENLELFGGESEELALNFTGVVDQWLRNASLPRSVFLRLQRSDGSSSSLGENWHGFGVASFEDTEEASLNHVRTRRAAEAAYEEEDEEPQKFLKGSFVSEKPNPFKISQSGSPSKPSLPSYFRLQRMPPAPPLRELRRPRLATVRHRARRLQRPVLRRLLQLPPQLPHELHQPRHRPNPRQPHRLLQDGAGQVRPDGHGDDEDPLLRPHEQRHLPSLPQHHRQELWLPVGESQ
uniref:TGFb_propeptide domain-containing protein n=1 Tax=Steinernema glaseri TaxID=37863 RepID=A0A1I7ZIB5_9BILA